MKPTYSNIARKAGVGTATVERVLNGRGGVTEATAEKVILAARSLEWPRRLPEKHLGIVRFEVLLAGPNTSFFIRLSKAYRRIAASLDPSIQIHVTFIDETDPKGIASRISDPSVRRSGLVIASPDQPTVRDALNDASSRELPVVQIVTRIVPGSPFVGIENYAAGRVAAMMMARMGGVSGPVAALCHSQAYAVHRERIRGFSDYLQEHGHGTDFVCLGFGRDARGDSADRTHEILRA